jgi:hypothetical protein
MFKKWFGGKKSNNEPRYAKSGEFVKCIDDREHCVVFGKVYKVLDTQRLPCCNTVSYDVGLSMSNTGEPMGDRHTTCHCSGGRTEIPGKGIRWAHHSRFALTDERPQEEEMTKEVEDKNSDKLVKKLIEELEISLN